WKVEMIPFGSAQEPSTPTGAGRAATGIGPGDCETQADKAAEADAITRRILSFIRFSRKIQAEKIRLVKEHIAGAFREGKAYIVSARIYTAGVTKMPAFRRAFSDVVHSTISERECS